MRAELGRLRGQLQKIVPRAARAYGHLFSESHVQEAARRVPVPKLLKWCKNCERRLDRVLR